MSPVEHDAVSAVFDQIRADLAAAKPCSRCGGPRDRLGQRYCRACHAEYQRRRRRRLAQQGADMPTTTASPITVDNPRVLTEGEREVILEALTIASDLAESQSHDLDPTHELVHTMRHASFAEMLATLAEQEIVLGDVVFDLDALDG